MRETLLSIIESWCTQESDVNSTASLLEWVQERNSTVAVHIEKNALSDSPFWFYDQAEGCIRNQNRSFFEITGFEQQLPDGTVLTQPILIQKEIGFLGIICKEFNGVMHFLMQAKIEPGNVNQVQISPTIQATRSNFTQKHGGKKPPYLDYFIHASKYEVVVDQIQSEQSSRFYKKRNRNIIIRVEEDVPLLASHRWMTLGQIKRLMREKNLVNMDTRTVLSCIPYCSLSLTEAEPLRKMFKDERFFRSVFAKKENFLPQVYHAINDYKMFTDSNPKFLPLHALQNWEMKDREITCREPFPFKVIFAKISIEEREVSQWTQPLFEAIGIATFGLICCHKDDRMLFLVKLMPEAGCFDQLELGPTVQKEAVAYQNEDDEISRFFFDRLNKGNGVVFDQLLSEEGGRFYHEENRNILIEVAYEELPELPEGYFLLDYRTLNEMVQINNTLNIQLRNLLSLLEA